MRNAIIFFLSTVAGIVLLTACNSKDTLVSQLPTTKTNAQQTSDQRPKATPADNARRITAKELHSLWEKGKVLIVDTRNEPAFKKEHIKGAILIPSPDFPARADELPRDKMIVAYCT
jgi:predicted sulfurtransferase